MINPIIQSILDNDLYLFTMQWATIKIFPELKVRYKFITRSEIEFPKKFDIELRKQVQYMSELALKETDYLFLKKIKYLPETYVNFLKVFKYNPCQIKIKQIGGHLDITLEGTLSTCMMWEVPLLSIISELYFIMTEQQVDLHNLLNKDMAKAKFLKDNGVNFVDMGQRRRYSFENHDRIVHIFSNYQPNFVGTSNVFLAKKYDLKPIGTCAHLWFMIHAALYGYTLANEIALDNWIKVYGGDLGIALSDTYTSNVFYKSFNLKFVKLFDGVRQDSGDTIEFADKTITHYKSLGIDPLTKTIIFSDNLNPEKAVNIKKYCENKINCSFGIGTNFTNDVGVTPLNMVIKISEVFINGEWFPAVKLSDDPGKSTGDPKEVEYCKYKLKITN
jgi:nicotinate phosphoribosyltransferase